MPPPPSDANPKETFIHHGAGLDPLNSMGASAGMGLGFGGGVVLRDRDTAARQENVPMFE